MLVALCRPYADGGAGVPASNRRIAEECFLSLNTVRTHVQNVLVKLGVHSKLEAVAFALEHQVVTAGTGTPAWAGDA